MQTASMAQSPLFPANGSTRRLLNDWQEVPYRRNPEEMLLLAILMRSLLDLFSPVTVIRAEARCWLLDVDTEDPWTIKWILTCLNLDHTKLLSKIQALVFSTRIQPGKKPTKVLVDYAKRLKMQVVR